LASRKRPLAHPGRVAFVLRRPRNVACRIDVVQGPDRRTVSVAGRLEQVHVPDLVSACSGDACPIVLDLTDLLSADSIALDALHRLKADGVELIRVPQYLGFTLDDIR